MGARHALWVAPALWTVRQDQTSPAALLKFDYLLQRRLPAAPAEAVPCRKSARMRGLEPSAANEAQAQLMTAESTDKDHGKLVVVWTAGAVRAYL